MDKCFGTKRSPAERLLLRFKVLLWIAIGLWVPLVALTIFESLISIDIYTIIGIVVFLITYALGLYAAKKKSSVLLLIYIGLSIPHIIGVIVGIAVYLMKVSGLVFDRVAQCSDARVVCDNRSFWGVVISVTLYELVLVAVDIYQITVAWKLRNVIVFINEPKYREMLETEMTGTTESYDETKNYAETPKTSSSTFDVKQSLSNLKSAFSLPTLPSISVSKPAETPKYSWV
eukprot:TRINITY_DN5054_c0_g1_i2.p1 TRINITY_DN5054_c0_g1~~TRINITY_DN5054_c0_g1_i2.p1  ORF type:complete len:231 (-),score=31.89 TRINITY_DN5054_c0_g1_i2:146-838(-)